MSKKQDLLSSQDAVLQQSIEILDVLGGKSDAKGIYEQFEQVLGEPLSETEANNVYQIISASTADACLVQPDGTCKYINTANDETFVLETNTDPAVCNTANTDKMAQALEQPNNPEGFTTIPESQASAVTEPVQLAEEGTEKANLANLDRNPNKDVAADAQAAIDVAESAKHKDFEDHRIDFDADRIKHDEKVQVREAARIQKHEDQIAKDKTKFMKDLHEMEIHHDEKVIAREDKREHKIEEDIIK